MSPYRIDFRQAANQHLFSTVRVETKSEEGIGCATAFFFRDAVEEGHTVDFLITNNHVVSGAKSVRIMFHVDAERDAQYLSIGREQEITS